jgi:heme exporter protein B
MTFFELFRAHFLFQFRNKQIFLATAFFTIFLIFLFTLTFPTTGETSATFYSGVFWISSFFAGNLVLSNQTQLQSNKFNQGVLLTGTDSAVIFVSKVLSSLLYMLFIQIILFVMMNLFFQLPPDISHGKILLYSVMGSLGYISIGTLFFSLAEFQNVKDLLITVLFYPLVIPLFLYLHKATTMIFDHKTPNLMLFIIGYDLIFVFLSAMLYEFVIEDNA